MKKTIPTVALLGNPNSGKTTIFNELTGARQHVGNYPGVTVERITGKLRTNEGLVNLIDLPGIYRLGGGSPEEEIVTASLSSGEIDVLVNIVDSTNFERHLYLTVQLAHFNLPVILVLNMSDEAQKLGMEFDLPLLEQLLGVKVLCTTGSKGIGIRELRALIGKQAHATGELARMKPLVYGEEETDAFEELESLAVKIPTEARFVCPDSYLAEKVLEGDPDIIAKLDSGDAGVQNLLARAGQLREKITQEYEMPVAIMFADKRYGLIAGLGKEVLKINDHKKRIFWTEKIDSIVTNKFLGVPIFLIAMYCVFYVTFTIGDPLIGYAEDSIGMIGEWVSPWLEGFPQIQSLVVEGMIGGVGGVVSFLPTILILFVAIAFLEASGYMARAAFIMDRAMHKMGLHGKSFVPMLIGFGCTVPAIMATRSIESKRDRWATIFILPLMSCGARLPIFVLFISALIPQQWQAETLWSLYILGILIAVICARILKSTLFKGESELFIMELPPYRMPSFKSVLVILWRRAYMYLRKAGTIILAASIVLWFLNTYPRQDEEIVEDSTPTAELAAIPATEGEEDEEDPVALAHAMENSYSGRIGKFFEPVSKYAGMDWQANSALIGAFAAKEVFVAQLGILFAVPEDEDEDDPVNLREAIGNHYTMLQGISIMVFCLVGFPCMASVATTRKETSWGFAIGNTLFLDVLGFILAVAVYQLGLLFFM